MNTFHAAVPLLVVFVVIGILASAPKRPGWTNERPWPLESYRPLSAPELLLYLRLTAALPDDIVLAQVQLQRFLRIRHGRHDKGLQNRFDRLSADFLVVSKRDASVITAIELDDKSHDAPSRKAADARKDHALRSAGVPLIRWQVRAIPSPEQIVTAINQVRPACLGPAA